MKKLLKVLKSYNLSDNIDKQLLINWGVGKENRGQRSPSPRPNTKNLQKVENSPRQSPDLENRE